MKKSWFERKIYNDGLKNENVYGYKYIYNDIKYGIYNCKEYPCQFKSGYIPVLICDNPDNNGLALITTNFKTIKECTNKVMGLIDVKKDIILEKSKI